MKKTITTILLFTCAALLTGCVTRTVTKEPKHRGGSGSGKTYGANPYAEVIEKKRVWIWQAEFRNP
jgi:hypothetical protein